ncbi:conserved oligomeric Golgi complex subunit 1, partial [Tremellales sp. Uapishka_1]
MSINTPAASHSSLPFSTPALSPTSSRRPSRYGPTPLFGVSEFARRPSEMPMMRRASGFSGTSTPSKRRMMREGSVNKDETDWAGMEPDDVFKRLPVGEVKRVEAKMRSEALNKQSELRAMVGTRYRDLLTSAHQITSLHSSSLRLSSSLKTISKTCANPLDSESVTEDDGDGESEQEDVMHQLPVAAHMKLLLDAPEALYSYLAHQSYLNAAFLWLLTRVVKEGLVAMPEEMNAPYLPLVQKQWETLLPFRSQIVQRATSSLRSREKLETKFVSETLLSIILLDTLPISDTLNLFLAQRTKTLRHILSHSPPDTLPSTLQLTVLTKRRNSRSSVREAAVERESIKNVLVEATTCLLDTIAITKAIFEKRKRTQGDESVMEELIKAIQEGEAVAVSHPMPTRQTSNSKSHQRRASRLASMSLSFPQLKSSSPAPVSTNQVLQSLPSSSILLRHLPNSITSFTPFITPSAPPALDDKLNAWQKSSIEITSQSMPSWLKGLNSVKDVWDVRSSLRSLLGDQGFENEIKEMLEGEWSDRVRVVWKERLEEVLAGAESKIRDAGEDIRRNGPESDVQPESFLFSDIHFPSVSTSTSHATAFSSFITSLQKRSSYRTPLLDSVLLLLEDSAKELKGDMKSLPKSLVDDYKSKVEDMLTGLVKVLERILGSMGAKRGDEKQGVEAELFVGRVALYLTRSSKFLDDVVGGSGVDLGPTKTALLGVHAQSTENWKRTSIGHAVDLLGPLFDVYKGPREIQSTWQGPLPTQPSSCMMTSLYSLVTAVRSLGIAPGIHLDIVKNMLSDYVTKVKGLPGWKSVREEGIVQACVDIGFLDLLIDVKSGDDATIESWLNDRAAGYPMEPSPTYAVAAVSPDDASRGPSMSKAGTEFKSPLAVAKPGKRFGLLSVVG